MLDNWSVEAKVLISSWLSLVGMLPVCMKPVSMLPDGQPADKMPRATSYKPQTMSYEARATSHELRTKSKLLTLDFFAVWKPALHTEYTSIEKRL